MLVKLKTPVLWPHGSLTEAGATLDVLEDMAADWIKRGIAEPVTSTPAPTPVYTPPSKGKR